MATSYIEPDPFAKYMRVKKLVGFEYEPIVDAKEDKEKIENKKLIKDFISDFKKYELTFGELNYESKPLSKRKRFPRNTTRIPESGLRFSQIYYGYDGNKLSTDKNEIQETILGIQFLAKNNYYVLKLEPKSFDDNSYRYNFVSKIKRPVIGNAISITGNSSITRVIEKYYFVKIKNYKLSSKLFSYSSIKKSMFISNSFDETYEQVKRDNQSLTEQQVLDLAHKAKRKKYVINKIHFNHLCKKDNIIRDVVEILDKESGRNVKFAFEDVEFIKPDFDSLSKCVNPPKKKEKIDIGTLVTIKNVKQSLAKTDYVYTVKELLKTDDEGLIRLAVIYDEDLKKLITVKFKNLKKYDPPKKKAVKSKKDVEKLSEDFITDGSGLPW